MTNSEQLNIHYDEDSGPGGVLNVKTQRFRVPLTSGGPDKYKKSHWQKEGMSELTHAVPVKLVCDPVLRLVRVWDQSRFNI